MTGYSHFLYNRCSLFYNASIFVEVTNNFLSLKWPYAYAILFRKTFSSVTFDRLPSTSCFSSFFFESTYRILSLLFSSMRTILKVKFFLKQMTLKTVCPFAKCVLLLFSCIPRFSGILYTSARLCLPCFCQFQCIFPFRLPKCLF